ncbi:hypothetical protein PRZ48_014451 [Zasmidium cellare]|uniref:Uncharacterized protein n=1 Tax=Zasmidium cellare TaxID=395010 RepID=A0ABR0DYT2_ZASCE|nr:hypothetical protein PRZ48_014451 [Zasmidium cellare]
MRPILLTTLSSLLTVTTARIVGFATPETVAPDSTVKLEIIAQNDIQAAQDVAFSFGLSPAANAHPGTLGTLLSSKFLGPDLSNVVENITHYVHVPATTKKGKYVLSGAQFSLFGVSTSPTLVNYVANVTVGDSTSATYVDSTLVTTQ